MVFEARVVEFAQGLSGVEERSEEGMRIFLRDGRVFLVLFPGTEPLRVELRCDKKLSQVLRERYESVLESLTLGREGIEVLCTGQLSEDEILDLVRHAYEISA